MIKSYDVTSRQHSKEELFFPFSTTMCLSVYVAVLCAYVPAYNMSYDKIEMWSYIDIAAVKVESPYDFKQILPVPECSSHPEPEAWVPNKIQINYEAKYQSPGTDSLVLGWGHKSKWRAVGKI